MKRKPNVVLVILDTARADHFSCYGYEKKTTPNIDKIAKHGVVYKNAFSPAIWSPPSHASIFTGKYPSTHGTLGRNVHLSNDNTTIAEILQSNGYMTIGFSNCTFVARDLGFGKGFKTFINPSSIFLPALKAKAAKLGFILESVRYGVDDLIRTVISGPDQYSFRTNRLIKDFLRSEDLGKKPFFMFVNFFDCHAPYSPPGHFKKKFCPDLSKPRIYAMEFLLNSLCKKSGQKISRSNVNLGKVEYISGGSSESRLAYMAGEIGISHEEWEVVRSWYDGELFYVDQRLGELYQLFSEQGLTDDTIFVVTADHGENLGDHNLAGHHFCVFDTLLRVPLVISYLPLTSKGTERSSIVSTLDIFPTIMSLCNLNAPKELQGKSLEPLSDQTLDSRFVCSESGKSVTEIGLNHARARMQPIFSRFRSKLRHIDAGFKSIRDSTYKYILSTNGDEQLYNIRDDPHEENCVLDEHQRVAAELRRNMEKIIDVSYFGPEGHPETEVESARIRRLKALGYA